MGVWTALHIAFLFWGVSFPFSYRQLTISGRIHYAHIISVLLALLLPLPGALVPLKEGFVITHYPTIACIGRNADYNYYLLILPICIILGVTSCLATLRFCIAVKVTTANIATYIE